MPLPIRHRPQTRLVLLIILPQSAKEQRKAVLKSAGLEGPQLPPEPGAKLWQLSLGSGYGLVSASSDFSES